MFLPVPLQLTRALFYFFPLFYLVSIRSINFIKNKLSAIVIVILLLFSVYLSYPPNFISSPHVPNEINYIDNTAYMDAFALCKNKLVITSSRPGIAEFFGIRPDYFVNTKYSDPVWVSSSPESGYAYYSEKSNTFFDTLTDVPILASKKELEGVYNAHATICYLAGSLPDSWVDGGTRNFIKENFIEYNKTYNTNENWARMHLYFSNQHSQLIEVNNS